MSNIFRPDPTGSALTDDAFIRSAMEQPLGIGATFFDQAEGGILSSPGLGTIIRQSELPAEAPTEQETIVTPTDTGDPTLVPDTPQMRRRITAFEAISGQDVQARQETPQELGARRQEVGALSEDAYKASRFFRSNVPWDSGMTEDRAAALATMSDAKKVREFYAEKRPITSFFGNLAGQAFDPINYIPVFGEAVQAAAIARAGGIAGRALVSSADAAVSTAITGFVTSGARAELGDDVSWQSQITDIAIGALIGGAFGSVSGTVLRRADARAEAARTEAASRLDTLKATQEARVVLNDAIDGMVQDGEVRLSPASANFVQTMTASVNVEAEIARVARFVDAPAFERLEALEQVRATNQREIDTLVSQSTDNEKYGPTRRAMIEADQIQERLTKLDQTIASKTSPKEVTKLNARREELRGQLREKVRSVDDVLAQEIEDIDTRLALRRQVNEPVVAELATLQERTKQVRREAAASVQGMIRSGDLQAQGPTYLDMQGRDVRGMSFEDMTAPTIDATAPSFAVSADVAGAAARVAKTGTLNDFAKQMHVDQETGAFREQPDLDQLIAEGRVSDEDMAALAQADEDFKTASGWGEALKTAMGCTI